jgi:hypothetical protein
VHGIPLSSIVAPRQVDDGAAAGVTSVVFAEHVADDRVLARVVVRLEPERSRGVGEGDAGCRFS